MRITDLALRLLGSSSGEQIVRAAAAASGAITLPAGTTDFSGTGGASQVVRQSTAGGPFTVAQLAAADVSGALTGNQTIAISGDISGSGTTAITATLPNVNANSGTFQGITVNAKGQVTAAANQSYLTASGVSGMTAGQIPIAATATTITSSGNLSGAVTTSGSLATTLATNAVATANITSASVTYAKIQNVAASRVLGNPTGSPAAPSEISLGTGLTFAGTVLNGAVGTLTGVTAGTGLTGGGTSGNPTISLTTPVAVANGGTGLASGTSGGIPYYSATGTIASSALLTANALVKGGGAGVAPVASTATVDGSGDLTVAGPQLRLAGNANAILLGSSGAGYNVVYSPDATRSIQVGDATQANTLYRNTSHIFQDAGGGTTLATLTAASLAVTGQLTATGRQTRAGTGGATTSNQFNIAWTTGAQLWIDTVNTGTITVSSDYRIKENIAALPSMWDRVKALRPVAFNFKDNPELLSRADPAERWGFVAHELQETLIASAASGYKDAPNIIQSPDLLTLLATVTKALQEAMARIEALEAQTPPAG